MENQRPWWKPKKIKNKILDEFTEEVRSKVDSLIDQGYGSPYIRDFLQKEYPNLTIPTLPTIVKYIHYYRQSKALLEKKKEEEKLLFGFEYDLSQIRDGVQQVDSVKNKIDKVRLLEGLSLKCIHRISELESIQRQGKLSTTLESVILKYISEVRNIVETAARLTGELSENDEVVIQIVQGELSSYLNIFKEVILEVCPEKFHLVKEKLKEKLSGKKIIDQEVSEGELNPTETPPSLGGTPDGQMASK